MSQIAWSNLRVSNGLETWTTGAFGVFQIRWTPVFTGQPYGFDFTIDYSGGARSWNVGVASSHPLQADGVDLILFQTADPGAGFVSAGVVIGGYYIAVGPSVDSVAPPNT